MNRIEGTGERGTKGPFGELEMCWIWLEVMCLYVKFIQNSLKMISLACICYSSIKKNNCASRQPKVGVLRGIKSTIGLKGRGTPGVHCA